MPLLARILLLRGPQPPADEGTPSAAEAARRLARDHGRPLDELAVPEDGGPLDTLAALLVPLDFAAVYLALATRPDV